MEFNLFLIVFLHVIRFSVCFWTPQESTSDESTVKYDNRSRAGNFGWSNCPSCGIVKRNRIVGGRTASITDYPWTKLEVIAAVDDVTSQKAYKTKVIYGKFHDKFDANTYDYDVGVLKLEEPLPVNKGLRSVCLPSPDDDPITHTGVVSGWGAAKETDNFGQNHLMSVGVPIVSDADCRSAKGFHDQKITGRMLCAGYLDGSMDACTGDSGGPLIWYNSGCWKQVGIVSWGIGCARQDYYGVYTKVTTMLQWISTYASNGQC